MAHRYALTPRASHSAQSPVAPPAMKKLLGRLAPHILLPFVAVAYYFFEAVTALGRYLDE